MDTRIPLLFSFAALLAGCAAPGETPPPPVAAPVTGQAPASRNSTRRLAPASDVPGLERTAADPAARSFTLVIQTFVASREVMNAALTSKDPYASFVASAKDGKALIESSSGGGVFGTTKNLTFSSMVPVVSGRSATSTSVEYKDIGTEIGFTLVPAGSEVIADIFFAGSTLLEGEAVGEIRQPVLARFSTSGVVRLHSGVPGMIFAGELAGDKSHRPRVVFVRADW